MANGSLGDWPTRVSQRVVSVWVVIGRKSPQSHTRYVIEVWGHREGADAQAARWRRQHPKGEADVEKYTVLDGVTHTPEPNA